jgi:hypothetical protein
MEAASLAVAIKDGGRKGKGHQGGEIGKDVHGVSC